MKKGLIILGFVLITSVSYGQIIADHSVVDKYDDIPQQWIDSVKKMWFDISGESHSKGYYQGLDTLETLDSKFQVYTQTFGTPVAPSDQFLRANKMIWGDVDNATGWTYWTGEEDWWTNSAGINQIKAGLNYCFNNNLKLSVLGFGWCYDGMATNVSSGTDPVTGNHWYGETVGGPEGQYKPWGLDDDDNSITGNTLNMDSYLEATQSFIDYCEAKGIPTKVIFTTGPVDDNNGNYSDEAMYQNYLKWEHIREYVKADPSRILFDYADILCYDDDGTETTSSWNGNTFPVITPTNLGAADKSHIGTKGTLRLAKAVWWLMARIAGWNDISTDISVGKSDKKESVFIVTDNEIHIKLYDFNKYNKVSLYNLTGSKISDFIVNSQNYKINTTGLSPGVYVVALIGPNAMETRKIVIR